MSSMLSVRRFDAPGAGGDAASFLEIAPCHERVRVELCLQIRSRTRSKVGRRRE